MDICIDHIRKAYGEKEVFADFSHRFRAGENHCILGASGCGKTTLLRLIARLETPDAGRIQLPAQTKISAVFQENRLIENLTAEKNVALTARRGMKRSEIHALLDALGIGEWAQEKTYILSGGMKRRLALARALAAEHDLLLLDEPFSGLDVDTAGRAMELLLCPSEGRTLICVTHDPTAAEALGADILRL